MTLPNRILRCKTGVATLVVAGIQAARSTAIIMLAIEDIEIPLRGWSQIASANDALRWRNDAGDQLSLNFFAKKPDIPDGPDTIAALRVAYREGLGNVGGLVEVEPTVVAGVPSVLAILKFPQDPTGMTYLGAVTTPFRDCSFVIKWQCPELGMTGLRDAAVFGLLAPPLHESTGQPEGWAADPYDPTHCSGALRNRSDDAEWDSRFPAHPLSRLRAYFRGLDDIRFSDAVTTEARYRGL